MITLVKFQRQLALVCATTRSPLLIIQPSLIIPTVLMSSGSGPQSNAPKLTPFAQAHPFRLTEPPNVDWNVGEGLSKTPLGRDWKTDEELGWKTWDMAQTSPS
jgi:hypothetical protein